MRHPDNETLAGLAQRRFFNRVAGGGAVGGGATFAPEQMWRSRRHGSRVKPAMTGNGQECAA